MSRIEIRKQLSSEYKELCWKTFFTQKKRGIKFELHFPWFFNADAFFYTIEIHSGIKLIGGMTLKIEIKNNIRTAIIGLVCIDEDYRGLGYFSLLMNKADELMQCENIQLAILWSGQHHLYKKHGYKLIDHNVLIYIRKKNIIINNAEKKIEIKHYTLNDKSLPPFAIYQERLEWDNSYIVYCASEKEFYVIDYECAINDMCSVMDKLSPNGFYINTTIDQLSFFYSLRALLEIKSKDQNIRMIKIFANDNTEENYNSVDFKLNERI
ncbi:GNAT family N-acetyltransferase [Buttiauxella massiliensis]|uniref:GNAT family N-acetyltransferase n=1 Tax=Buttiauxella massiliensis TaxID=2831590 RepID=UPI00186A75C3|nr:GNAT family N-acetyltransferase [Buttiauxella massiliensis]